MEAARPFLPVPQPVAFTVFGLDIMWYAIMLTSGMIAGVFLAYRRSLQYGIKQDTILDIALYCVPAGIVGGRAYYVIFQWEHYKNDLLQIFNTSDGGKAIHGALIGAIGLGVILLRKWKINVWDTLDLVAPAIALGQCIGRWGNYFNSEAHGGPCDKPWAILADGELVHPTFLYESIWCGLLVLLLLLLEKKMGGRSRFGGQFFCIYAFLYSLERIYVESLRTDSLMIGPFRQAMVFSAVCMIAAAAGYLMLRKRALLQPAAVGTESEPEEAVQQAGEAFEEEPAKMTE